MQAATLAIAQARNLLTSVKAARDASLARLRKRLSNLSAELEQVLPPSDGRGYDFGFRRLIDGRQPAAVNGVAVNHLGDTANSNGIPAPSLAAANESITAETQSIPQNLPTGVPLVIAVSARNRSGETAPTEIEITI